MRDRENPGLLGSSHGKDRQPYNTFFHPNVKPEEVSSIILSGGKHEPYYYSLGNQSTVPFVKLQGSGNTQKEFTWGETIEVFPGQNVKVQSASYMAGDIQIQSGRDIANKPSRITTPIQVTPFAEGSFPKDTSVSPLYPCDCRQAKRAYLGGNFSSDNIDSLVFYGINRQHSWPGDVAQFFTSVPPTGKKYFWFYNFTPLTFYAEIPMGFGAQYAPTSSTNPMILTDFVNWTLTTSEAGQLNMFFYVLEY